MLNNFLKKIELLLSWKTDRKLIVIESDDWGSYRFKDTKSVNELISSGFLFDKSPAARFDSLERALDLERLFDVLSTYRDDRLNSPIITALSCVANPDFKTIKDNSFDKYYYLNLPDSEETLYGTREILPLWKEGIDRNLFRPQFHGREHVNVNRWMRDLKSGNSETCKAFEHYCWGVYSKSLLSDYQPSYDVDLPEDIELHREILVDGIDLFCDIIGYRPDFFVPPNGAFNSRLLDTLRKGGIRQLTLKKMQIEPQGNGKTKRKFRYLGLRSSQDQVYLTRNCFFEPSELGELALSKCLQNIQNAFLNSQPAVISTHRWNYIGRIDENNSSVSLKLLDRLIRSIISRWPDAVFIDSSTLGRLIRGEEDLS